MSAYRVVARGRVQGVGFRYSMVGIAREARIAGWVRNRRDGSVEALVQGEPDAVERVLAWCRTGPAGASVTGLDVVPCPEDAALTRFESAPTA
jgi:acylphosphatase